MDPLGILLYGYDEQFSEIVRLSVQEIMKREVLLLNANEKEKSKILEILDGDTGEEFEDRESKVLVFLGFSDEEIKKTLAGFPVHKDLPRPIFAVLTEENIKWTLEDLIEHLEEEKRCVDVKKQK